MFGLVLGWTTIALLMVGLIASVPFLWLLALVIVSLGLLQLRLSVAEAAIIALRERLEANQEGSYDDYSEVEDD